MKRVRAIALLLALTGAAALARGTEPEAPGSPPASPSGGPMTLDHLDTLIHRVDPEAEREGPGWQLTVDGTQLRVIADETHDRMRIVVPVVSAEGLPEAMLQRLLQANFDTALDARYALARDVLWSTFLHPLASLDERLFLSGLGQTVNLARTYGTGFQSGELVFEGGDSQGLLERQRIDELLRKGQPGQGT